MNSDSLAFLLELVAERSQITPGQQGSNISASDRMGNLRQRVLDAQRQTPCPGLNRSSDEHHLWVCPTGDSKDQTICQSCAAKYGITGLTSSGLTKCYCDFDLHVPQCTNEVFRVGLWRDDLRTLYPFQGGVCDMQSGERFAIFIRAKLKENQRFRYSIYQNGVLLHSCPDYHSSQAMPMRGDKPKVFYFWPDVDMKDFYPNLVYTNLEFQFDIYNVETHDCTSDIAQYMGHFQVKPGNNGGLGSKYKSESGPLLRADIYDIGARLRPYNKLVPYTVKPVVLVHHLKHVESKMATLQQIRAVASVMDALEQQIGLATQSCESAESALEEAEQRLARLKSSQAALREKYVNPPSPMGASIDDDDK